MINQTISHYRVTGQLGRGGMGVVYEAQDLTLGRKVALKFLPPDMAKNTAALDRFLQEARTASALNHPNICTIYAVEQAKLDDGTDVSFIAMELLEGQSLDMKLMGGALPLNQLLDISIQLTDALDAAHNKGIIHRDIKPANIFLNDRGQVKVLDFGLAKLTRRLDEMETMGGTPTAAQLTSPGATVGTIAYMSPEQARGEELDARSDLFSAGIVLYQMATGKLPFNGATSAVIFHAILEKDPVALQEANPALPPRLDEIAGKALEKERDLRYQSAADLRGDLRRLKRDTESSRKAGAGSSGTVTAASASSAKISAASTPAQTAVKSSAVISAVRQNKTGTGIAAVVALAVLAAAAYGVYSLTRGHRTAAFENYTVTKVTDTGNALLAAISPDGNYILSLVRDNGLTSLQLRNVPTNSTTQVQPPANVQYNGLRFSPDGNYLYFVRSDPGNDELKFLYRAPLLGGQAEKLAEDVDSNITFSPDGSKLAFMRYDNPNAGEYQLIVKDLRSGAETPLTNGLMKEQLSSPAWSPDGKVIVCYILQPQGALTGLEAVDAGTGKHKALVRSENAIVAHPEWLPDGSGLLALYREGASNFTRYQIVRFSYPSAALTPVTRDAGNYVAISAARNVPELAAVANEEHWNVELVAAGASDSKVLGKANESFSLAWLPDGKLITDKDYSLQAINPQTGAQAALGSDVGVLEWQQQSCRDGRLVFLRYSPESRQVNVWSMDASGEGRRKLTTGSYEELPHCSPDMQWVYFIDTSDVSLMRVPLQGGTPQKVSDLHIIDGGDFDVSADGTALLFVTLNHAEGHKEHVVEVAVDTGKVRREIAMQKPWTGRIQYSVDGKALEYVVRENGMDNLWRQPLDGSAGKWETAFKSEHISHFAWSPDGKRLAMSRGHTDSDVVLMKDAAK